MVDWAAPTKTEPPSGRFARRWAADEDERGVSIYALPPDGVNLPLQLIARVERKEDADLIVSLYEKVRLQAKADAV